MTRKGIFSLLAARYDVGGEFPAASSEKGPCGTELPRECLDFLERERIRIRELQGYERGKGGCRVIAGLDESGRGPLAGPVVASAVVFTDAPFIPFVDDSKKLLEGERLQLSRWIRSHAAAVGIGIVEHYEIDSLNVHRASLEAMARAVRELPLMPDLLIVDGLFTLPGFNGAQQAVVKGDSLSFSIACASIMAKTTRDAIMEGYERQYPGYGFSRHKGYPTAEHLRALRERGVLPVHRRSFGPVKECLQVSHGR
ncbi:MAG: ribonuclease HII [Candidatus Eremiobacteraeota bacterium]|nr:ribonuclease HII [Candidatus Eremiobacteraeota bacterium]